MIFGGAIASALRHGVSTTVFTAIEQIVLQVLKTVPTATDESLGVAPALTKPVKPDLVGSGGDTLRTTRGPGSIAGCLLAAIILSATLGACAMTSSGQADVVVPKSPREQLLALEVGYTKALESANMNQNLIPQAAKPRVAQAVQAASLAMDQAETAVQGAQICPPADPSCGTQSNNTVIAALTAANSAVQALEQVLQQEIANGRTSGRR
jgi:hypothetical protein